MHIPILDHTNNLKTKGTTVLQDGRQVSFAFEGDDPAGNLWLMERLPRIHTGPAYNAERLDHIGVSKNMDDVAYLITPEDELRTDHTLEVRKAHRPTKPGMNWIWEEKTNPLPPELMEVAICARLWAHYAESENEKVHGLIFQSLRPMPISPIDHPWAETNEPA